ncbi:MAG: deoxyribonuclease IV [Acidobacteria bacterium]|nr:deoxyribonuclease IV [Acidobacteriota bacterium]
MKELLAGAHMSIAGGMHKAFERGKRVRCKTIQIFLKNSNQWKAKPLTEEARILFQKSMRESDIHPVLAHAGYLINLASPDRSLYEKSLRAFVEELRRANFLGVPYLVLHPGAHVGEGAESGIARVANALTCALDQVEPPVMVLLENTAGQGSSLGSRFEEFASILERIGNPGRVGFCLDTCHAFAAGYDIRTADGYEKTMREFDRLIGIEKILAFHVNDSSKDLGCRVDRHCHIGKGFLGLQAFRLLVNDARFAAVPKILETPKGKDLQEDRRNLATLRSLLDSKFRIRSSKPNRR